MHRLIHRTLPLLALSAILWLGGPLHAADQDVTLDFANAEIDAVARTMSTLTGRNVVVDPRVRGTLSLTSTTPVTPAQALALFAAQLRTQGFAMIETDNMVLILPEADAKLRSGDVNAQKISGGPQIETHIFRLVHEDANNLVPVLRPLISPNNTINVNPGNNSLIITDYGDNLKRLARIITALDISNATDIEMIHLRHSVASDIAPLAEQLVNNSSTSMPTVRTPTGTVAPGASAGGARATTLLAEPRSNAIIIRAGNATQLANARQIIEQLDQPPAQRADGSSGNIHVVHLKNADAAKLAVTLRAALASLPGAENTASGNSNASSASNTTGQGLSRDGGSQLSDGLDGGPTIDTTASNQPSTGGQIQADPASNSLIISAPEPVYRQLRSVIDQLDQRRAQVFVESLIAEVRADKAAEFGIQWQGMLGGRGDSNVGVIGTNLNAGTSNIFDLTAQFYGGEGLNTPPPGGLNLGWAHRYGNTYILGALANFIQTSKAGNVLSAPTLLTLDNEEARIVVGQNVPFITGSFTNTGSASTSVNPFQTFERKDVGLTLRVRPQINENGTIKMVIYQETSDVDRSSIGSPQGLITNKRAIESSVLVDDGSIVVLGGLMEDQFVESEDKIPGLGDVPVLGNLFKSRDRNLVKTSLMVFLRPVIVRNALQSEQFSLDRYDLMRSSQLANQPEDSSVLQINRAPVMPEITPRNPEAWRRPVPSEPLLDPRNTQQPASSNSWSSPNQGTRDYHGVGYEGGG